MIKLEDIYLIDKTKTTKELILEIVWYTNRVSYRNPVLINTPQEEIMYIMILIILKGIINHPILKTIFNTHRFNQVIVSLLKFTLDFVIKKK